MNISSIKQTFGFFLRIQDKTPPFSISQFKEKKLSCSSTPIYAWVSDVSISINLYTIKYLGCDKQRKCGPGVMERRVGVGWGWSIKKTLQN
jgi:hypothetical protein